MIEHEKHKEEFYKVYPKYDYEENDRYNTVSENVGNPLLHLEDSLEPLFGDIISHVKKYTCEVLKYKDIFNYVITKKQNRKFGIFFFNRNHNRIWKQTMMV